MFLVFLNIWKCLIILKINVAELFTIHCTRFLKLIFGEAWDENEENILKNIFSSKTLKNCWHNFKDFKKDQQTSNNTPNQKTPSSLRHPQNQINSEIKGVKRARYFPEISTDSHKTHAGRKWKRKKSPQIVEGLASE